MDCCAQVARQCSSHLSVNLPSSWQAIALKFGSQGLSSTLCCRFIPLLFSLLSTPSEVLKGAAADVLTEIIMKRMEPQSKFSLIQQLGLGRVCTQWGSGLPVQEDEVELASKYAKLLAAIVTGNMLQPHANNVHCVQTLVCILLNTQSNVHIPEIPNTLQLRQNLQHAKLHTLLLVSNAHCILQAL